MPPMPPIMLCSALISGMPFLPLICFIICSRLRVMRHATNNPRDTAHAAATAHPFLPPNCANILGSRHWLSCCIACNAVISKKRREKRARAMKMKCSTALADLLRVVAPGHLAVLVKLQVFHRPHHLLKLLALLHKGCNLQTQTTHVNASAMYAHTESSGVHPLTIGSACPHPTAILLILDRPMLGAPFAAHAGNFEPSCPCDLRTCCVSLSSFWISGWSSSLSVMLSIMVMKLWKRSWAPCSAP